MNDHSNEDPQQVPSTGEAMASQWFSRLGLSGKLLVFGGGAGVISCMLPLMTVSIQFMGNSNSQSVSVVKDWRGLLCLLCYIAVIVLSFFLFPSGKPVEKQLCVATLGVAGGVALFALWLLILAMSNSQSAGNELGGASASAGIGAFTNLLSAGAVAAGAYMKGKEERVV